MASEGKISADVVLKSGLWYTIGNFAFRAVAFITTPIFTRLLSKAEYGEYNNITSWIAVLFIFTSCDLYTSIIRAKLDYEKDLERYSFSVLTLGSIISVALFAITMLFRNALADLMGIQPKYFYIMFVYLFFVQGYYVYITLERARYRYKKFSIITGAGIVLSCFFSLFLVLLMKDKLDARVYGQHIPYIVIGLVLYVLIAKKGKAVYLPYYRYGLLLSLPLVPHLLSMTILSASDRIMITKIAGAEYTAIYSVAYIVANIVSILLDSMNKAWAPWFLDSVKAKDLEAVKKAAVPYYGAFIAMIIGVLLAAPEVVMILGGRKYMEGVYVLPPLIVGCAFQFAYTMYVQVEFYEKKMKIVAVATSIAALINIVLNYVLIPYFGYIAAGYTSLVVYMILFLIHYYTACSLGYKSIFDRRIIIGGLGLTLGLMPIILVLYRVPNFVRYGVLAVYIIFLLGIVYHYRHLIKEILGRRKRKQSEQTIH